MPNHDSNGGIPGSVLPQLANCKADIDFSDIERVIGLVIADEFSALRLDGNQADDLQLVVVHR